MGVKLNLGKSKFSYSYGMGEYNVSFGWDNSSIDLQVGINKIGIGTSQSVEDITYYNQYYIRTIPFAFAVAYVGIVIVFAPETIPIICLAFA